MQFLIYMEEKFKKIKESVVKELACSAHSMDHVMRVYDLSLLLAQNEDVDLDVLKAATLLHDIARAKEDDDLSRKTDHAVLGAKMAVPILQELGFSEEKIKHIQDCIISHSYRKGSEAKTKEAQILFDADKLDALGAIGIARGFVWVGRNSGKIYADTDGEEYINDNLGGRIDGRIQDKTKHSPQMEFATKVKFLVDKLHTEKAKKIGKARLKYSESFLDRLEKEIKGEL